MVDYYGKCQLCGTQCFDRDHNILQKSVTIEYKLSDKSHAPLLFCEPCSKVPKGATEFATIEQNVYAGWEAELAHLALSEMDKQAYRNKYFSLKIVEKV